MSVLGGSSRRMLRFVQSKEYLSAKNAEHLSQHKKCASFSQETIIPARLFGPTDLSIGREHWRVIGSQDVNDRGTFHPLISLDPFVFLDESVVPVGTPGLGGGLHPHAGLIAFTYLSPENLHGKLTEEGRIQALDSINGLEKAKTLAGGFYAIRSGAGALHDERNETNEGFMNQLQLWMLDESSGFWSNMSSGSSKECNHINKVTQLFQPNEIPVVEVFEADESTDPIGHVRVMIGKNLFEGTASSPVSTSDEVVYLHATIYADNDNHGDEQQIMFDLPLENGFVYAMESAVEVNGTIVPERNVAAFRSGNVIVANRTRAASHPKKCSFLVVAARPKGHRFAKILGHGGALLGRDEEHAKALMANFEDNGKQFGPDVASKI